MSENLTSAICAVMSAVNYVQGTGQNTYDRYSYTTEEDLLRRLQPAMSAHGLALVPDDITVSTSDVTTAKGKTETRYDIIVRYILRHTSGETQRITAPGCGQDRGDKGVYKAMTGAHKYALRQLFCVPTGDEPENESQPQREPAKETPEQTKARRAEHDQAWENGGRERFFAAVGNVCDLSYSDLVWWTELKGRPRPSKMTEDQRRRMVEWLGDGGAAKVTADLNTARKEQTT